MLNFILVVLTCIFSIPIVFLVVQLAFANLHRATVRKQAICDLSQTVVMVPAHNEEDVIEDTLHSLIAELPTSRQVLVVADNCLDRTRDVATKLGVTVIERNDNDSKGKGFALKFGVDYLSRQARPPEYVVIVDADCKVKPGTLNALVHRCVETGGRPVQALDLMKSRESSKIGLKIAEFAWIVKNQVRPLGLMNLGLPCQLMGTGMLIPFELLQKIELGTSAIVEDMRLGIDCALSGYPPVFCTDGMVVSFFPESQGAQETQRQRWEHGHLEVIFAIVPNLLRVSIKRRDKNLIAMALDLMLPPLTFLVLTVSALFLLLFLFQWFFGTGMLAVYILFVVSMLFFVSLMLSWYRFARNVLSIGDFFWLPVYVVTKVPIYIGYWIARQTEWIRTKRD